MLKGAPSQTDDLTIPAFIRLKAKRTKWLYAPDKKWGSDYYTMNKNRASQTPGIGESIGTKALQPMVDDGRADSITVTAVVRTQYGLGVQIDIETVTGQQQQILFLPIGV